MASIKILVILAIFVAVAWTLETASSPIIDAQDLGMAHSSVLETIYPDLEVAEHKKKKYRGSSGGGSSEERR